MEHQSTSARYPDQLALGLGWFSIGLGIAELAAPGSVARLIGMDDDAETRRVLRGFGARELGNGVAILAQPDRAGWVWSRVGGDMIDLAFLASAPRAEAASRGRLATAAAAVLGVTALDVFCAQQLGRENAGRDRSGARTISMDEVTTINRPIGEVYRTWKDFERFPRFMRHLESVSIVGDRRSRWRARGPAGTTFEWEAELLEDLEDELIAWRSVEGGDVRNRGSVWFRHAPGARGTEVRVHLEYSPPAGALGRGIAWLSGKEPEQQIHEDLHRFKQLMETGEIPISEGPGLWRPAQPPADPRKLAALAGVHR